MKFLFVGDIMLGRLINEELKGKSPEFPWGNTLGIFAQADLRIVNLECALTDWGEPWSSTPKSFHFRSDAKNISVLKSAGINMVSVANNHALDFGYKGLAEMIKILKENNIVGAGGGKDAAEAAQPAAVEFNGKKIGMIAFTDNEPAWEAGITMPGIFFVPSNLEDLRATKLLENISSIRQEVDYLVVSAHWGPNWGYQPLPEHISLARALVDAGADVVFGHSAHVFKGIELYNGKPIFYSTGDFIDDYAVSEEERNDETFIFLLDRNGPARILLYPAIISNSQVNLATGERAEEISKKMINLCAALNTTAQWDPELKVLVIQII